MQPDPLRLSCTTPRCTRMISARELLAQAVDPLAAQRRARAISREVAELYRFQLAYPQSFYYLIKGVR
jgi:hypothetical protein